jgi:hypothetical protein
MILQAVLRNFYFDDHEVSSNELDIEATAHDTRHLLAP